MSNRVLFNNDMGVQTYVEISEDGKNATISHDVDSNVLKTQLDLNTRIRNELDGYFVGSKRGISSVAMKSHASIPAFVCEYWKNNLGVDVYSQDEDMKAKVMALLDDPDWSALRTSEGHYGKKTKWV
jgi:hypothetical protein